MPNSLFRKKYQGTYLRRYYYFHSFITRLFLHFCKGTGIVRLNDEGQRQRNLRDGARDDHVHQQGAQQGALLL